MQKLMILFLFTLSFYSYSNELRWEILLEDKILTIELNASYENKVRANLENNFKKELRKLALENKESLRAQYILFELDNETIFESSSFIDALFRKKNKSDRLFSGLFPCMFEIKDFDESTFQDQIKTYIKEITYERCVEGTALIRFDEIHVQQFEKKKKKYLFHLDGKNSNFLKKRFADELGAFESEDRIKEKMQNKYIDLFDYYGAVIRVHSTPRTFEDAISLIYQIQRNDLPKDFNNEYNSLRSLIKTSRAYARKEIKELFFLNHKWHRHLNEFIDYHNNQWVLKFKNIYISLNKKPEFKDLNLNFLKEVIYSVRVDELYGHKKEEMLKILDLISSNKFDAKIKRELHDNYAFERFFFAMKSIKAHLSENKMEGLNLHVANSCTNESRYEFSIIPFRPGDLNYKCNSIVHKAVNMGFNKVTLFYPIPYAGGHNKGYFTKKDEYPKYNEDYKFEDIGLISKEELFSCLDVIDKANLKLNWVPHLESIVTLNSFFESEWRIFSEIPHDEYYYERAYTPLLKYLELNPKAFNKRLKVSLSAESELGLFRYPKKSLETQQKLKEELLRLKKDFEITLNTNGDFYHIQSLENLMTKNKCEDLKELLTNIDRLSPTMYEEHKHIIDGSFVKSRKNYLKNFMGSLKKMCPKQNFSFLKRKNFSIGEFHLVKTDENKNYVTFQEELDEYATSNKDPHINATFWNLKIWDDICLTAENCEKDTTKYKSLIKATSRCE